MPLMRRHFSQEEITKHVVAKVGRAGLQPAWCAPPPPRLALLPRLVYVSMSVCQFMAAAMLTHVGSHLQQAEAPPSPAATGPCCARLT